MAAPHLTMLRRSLLTLLAVVLPGAPQAIGRRWAAAAVLGLPSVTLIGLVAGSFGRAGAVHAALDPALLDRAGWAVVCLGALAAISVTETAIHVWARPGGNVARVAGIVGVVALAACPAAAGTSGLWYAGEHRDALNRVFRGGAVRAVPGGSHSVDDADAPVGTPSGSGRLRVTGGSTPAAPTEEVLGASISADGRWNILLFGGDAGKGRSGLRTDAMILLSVDRRTGDTAMVSVPRNLARLPMPAGPLKAAFPKGWNDLANAFYGYVRNNPALGDGSEQAAEHALTAAIAEALGVPVDNYLLVDMGGFIDVIDALGGVDLTLSKAVPAPGNPYEAKHAVKAWYGPGHVHLDGTDALAYSRSRDGDSDYRRMERQRCLLGAAARQVSAKDLLLRYDQLLGALERSVRSDLTAAQARSLVDLYAKVDRTSIRSLGLVPPLVNTGAPDYAKVRRLVAETLRPDGSTASASAARTTAAAVPAAPTTAAASAKARPGATTSTSAADVGPAVVLDDASAC